MPDNFSLTLIGDYDRIITAFNDLKPKTSARIMNRLQQSADRVYDVSQSLVPVGETGDLKESGHVSPGVEDDGSVIYFDVTYGDGQGYGDKYGEEDGYAWFVEMGTVNMKPQPYLGPAFEEESQKLLTRIGNILDG